MNEAKVYADNYGETFTEERHFLDFLTNRSNGAWWQKETTQDIQFRAMDDGSAETQEIIDEYEQNGLKDVMDDTFENTRLLLQAQDRCYPVRNCAIKTILDRARISGNALSKVEKPVLAKILNYCLGVTNGSALLRFSEGKISAVHGGDASEYAILEMPELFGAMAEYLESTFPGCHFAGAAYDHSIATAVWEIEQDSLIQTYKEAMDAHGIPYSDLKPALRLTTSDVGVSGANIYPTLLSGGDEKIITLGSPLKLEHKAGATLDKFKSNLPMIYAQYTVAIGNLMNLLKIEIDHPVNCLLSVCKRIGVGKKLAFRAAELFEAQNGDTPCTAHDVYYGISEVIFMLQCDGASGSKIAQMEENVARAFTVRWKDYDIPGEAKW